jgi:hypothetical protein
MPAAEPAPPTSRGRCCAAFDLAGAVCPPADLDGNGVVTAAELLRIYVAIVDPPTGCTAEADCDRGR